MNWPLVLASFVAALSCGCGRVEEAAPPAPTAAGPAASLSGSGAAHLPMAAPPAEPVASRELASLTARVEALERQARNAAVLSPLPADRRAAIRPSEADLRAGPPLGADAGPSSAQPDQDRLLALDEVFRQEKVNAGWAAQSTAVLRRALPPPVNATSIALHTVECRSQSCRVEVGSGNLDVLRQELPLLAQRLADRFPSMSVVARSDGMGATLYFRN